MAALVAVPLIGIVFVISSFGDCAPDVECHRGIEWSLFGGAIAIAAVIGLTVRSLTNWINRRWGDDN